MNKKVAILGKCSTNLDAPFNDRTFDIWAFNVHKNASQFPRIDVWFDLHNNVAPNPNANVFRKDFPIKECEALVGGKYFNNSVSYLIAYAILKGYEEIWLYGMRFCNDKESRNGEYNNVRELIFFAKGKGIRVYAPSDKVMLKEYPEYGA